MFAYGPINKLIISFYSRDKFSKHMEVEHSDVTNWPCTKCQLEYANYRLLYQHFYVVHQEGEYRCSRCHFVASNRQTMYTHNSRTHNRVPFKCDECGKSFNRKKQLELHSAEHWSFASQKLFGCTMCGKWFAHQYQLDYYMRTHLAPKPRAS